MKLRILAAAAALLALAAPAVSQSGGDFAIVRATIDGGGSTERSPDPVLVRGTIGQPDAGASYKGIYYLTGGFWSTQERLGIFFIDGFESGDTSSWSTTTGGAPRPAPAVAGLGAPPARPTEPPVEATGERR